MILFNLFHSPVAHEPLKSDDLNEFKTYVIYWKRFGTAEPDVIEMVGNTKKGNSLLLDHIKSKSEFRCIYSSLDDALDQLFIEAQETHCDAYILCSKSSYQPQTTDIKILVNKIEKAVEFKKYFLHKKQSGMKIENVMTICRNQPSKIKSPGIL